MHRTGLCIVSRDGWGHNQDNGCNCENVDQILGHQCLPNRPEAKQKAPFQLNVINAEFKLPSRLASDVLHSISSLEV